MSKDFSILKDSKVLVVDDEPEFRSLIAEYFQVHGMTCVTASNGRDALEKLENESFDVILSDINMPELQGMEFLKTIRSKFLYTPLIFMSAYTDRKKLRTSIQLGAFDFLDKPFKLEELTKTVQRAMKAGHYQRKIDYIRRERNEGLVEIINGYEQKIMQLRLDNHKADESHDDKNQVG